MVGEAGIEPETPGLEGRCSIHLSYSPTLLYSSFQPAGAFWLLDEIALANAYNRSVKAEEFQVWTLTRNKTGNGAMLPGGSPIQLHDVSVMGAPLQ